MQDRFGLGWRPQLAAGILANLDRVDVVEVIADDYVSAPRRQLRALRTLATQVPIVLHGVTMGLASAVPVADWRLARMSRLVEQLQPASWSEHLAFVRGGGIEIGHLAAPPRTAATIAGTVRNLQQAAGMVGAKPLVENVATLIDPPGSTTDEATWITTILEQSGCDLLLDLHNLYANAVNFGFDPFDYLARLPADRIAAIHLAGGRWVPVPGERDRGSVRRLLDDHLHDIPEPVYALLRKVGILVKRPLTVIIERDGQYPAIEQLLAELERAREALQQGRTQQLDTDKEHAA
ncbi:MAG: DUF692 family multinuclear iron-containing protein [Candidatus Binatia bacterium]